MFWKLYALLLLVFPQLAPAEPSDNLREAYVRVCMDAEVACWNDIGGGGVEEASSWDFRLLVESQSDAFYDLLDAPYLADGDLLPADEVCYAQIQWATDFTSLWRCQMDLIRDPSDRRYVRDVISEVDSRQQMYYYMLNAKNRWSSPQDRREALRRVRDKCGAHGYYRQEFLPAVPLSIFRE
jgi:hypothetical protein